MGDVGHIANFLQAVMYGNCGTLPLRTCRRSGLNVPSNQPNWAGNTDVKCPFFFYNSSKRVAQGNVMTINVITIRLRSSGHPSCVCMYRGAACSFNYLTSSLSPFSFNYIYSIIYYVVVEALAHVPCTWVHGSPCTCAMYMGP